MYSVNITDLAEEDILTTINYISGELNAPIAANRLLDEIDKHEENLSISPNTYPNVPDEYLASLGLKFVIIKNYLMFYLIDEKNNVVNVIRFLYNRRDWKNILLDYVYPNSSCKCNKNLVRCFEA